MRQSAFDTMGHSSLATVAVGSSEHFLYPTVLVFDVIQDPHHFRHTLYPPLTQLNMETCKPDETEWDVVKGVGGSSTSLVCPYSKSQQASLIKFNG